MLEINNVNKFYSDGIRKLHVLKNINLVVDKNDFISIQGPSGAGKSTLLHIIGGLDKPDDGNIFFNKKDIYNMKDYVLANLRNKVFGFVFQFYHLLPEFTVLENVILPGLISKNYKKKELIRKAKNILESVNMQHRFNYMPNQISGGEQQRVAIARAMILEPEILLCDEPTGNLDSNNAQHICELLTYLHNQEKQTIIIVTHQKSMSSIAKRQLFIEDGRIYQYKREV